MTGVHIAAADDNVVCNGVPFFFRLVDDHHDTRTSHAAKDGDRIPNGAAWPRRI